jgi:hypothetical protein
MSAPRAWTSQAHHAVRQALSHWSRPPSRPRRAAATSRRDVPAGTCPTMTADSPGPTIPRPGDTARSPKKGRQMSVSTDDSTHTVALEVMQRMLAKGSRPATRAIAEGLCSPDLVDHQFGLAGLGRRAETTCAQPWTTSPALPRHQFTIEDSVMDGDRIWVRARGRGRDRPTSDRRAAARVDFAIDIARIQDKRIVEHWGSPRQARCPGRRECSTDSKPRRTRRHPGSRVTGRWPNATCNGSGARYTPRRLPWSQASLEWIVAFSPK